MNYILIPLAVILIAIVALAIVGLREKKREQEYYDGYNAQQIQKFIDIQNAKKKSRQSTPRVPSIKK